MGMVLGIEFAQNAQKIWILPKTQTEIFLIEVLIGLYPTLFEIKMTRKLMNRVKDILFFTK